MSHRQWSSIFDDTFMGLRGKERDCVSIGGGYSYKFLLHHPHLTLYKTAQF